MCVNSWAFSVDQGEDYVGLEQYSEQPVYWAGNSLGLTYKRENEKSNTKTPSPKAGWALSLTELKFRWFLWVHSGTFVLRSKTQRNFVTLSTIEAVLISNKEDLFKFLYVSDAWNLCLAMVEQIWQV